jgi:hypothetical protein
MDFGLFSHTITGTSQELKIQNAIHVVLVQLNGFDKIKSKEVSNSIMDNIKNLCEPSLEKIHKPNKSA